MFGHALAILVLGSAASPEGTPTLKPPSGGPPAILPPALSLSVEEVTEPIDAIRCSVRSVDGRNHRFALRYHGRRGYRDPATGDTRTTDGRVEMMEDPSKLFAGYGRWESYQNWLEAHSAGKHAVFGARVRLDMQRTDFDRQKAATTTWAILVQTYFEWMPLTKAVGFCGVRSTKQTPLSESEIREHLASG